MTVTLENKMCRATIFHHFPTDVREILVFSLIFVIFSTRLAWNKVHFQYITAPAKNITK